MITATATDVQNNSLTDSLTGVLKHDYDDKELRAERYSRHA